MPRDAATRLSDEGHDVETVIDESLGGEDDPPVLQAATDEKGKVGWRARISQSSAVKRRPAQFVVHTLGDGRQIVFDIARQVFCGQGSVSPLWLAARDPAALTMPVPRAGPLTRIVRVARAHTAKDQA
jgi:hypothetical protein